MEHCWDSVVVLSCWAGRACSALPAHLHDVWEPDCQSESPLPLKPGSEQTLSLGWLRPRFWQHPGVVGLWCCLSTRTVEASAATHFREVEL
jgi:hypothetical protein